VTKPAKRTAYLISVHQRGEAVRVYAVVSQSTAAALALVGELALEDMQVEVVGSLGRDIARRLGLKPNEMCLI
jgi:hypothetical protein